MSQQRKPHLEVLPDDAHLNLAQPSSSPWSVMLLVFVAIGVVNWCDRQGLIGCSRDDEYEYEALDTRTKP